MMYDVDLGPFATKLIRLREQLREPNIHRDHLVPDHGLYELATQVRLHGRSAAFLAAFGADVWECVPSVRASFEAAIDLLWLVTADDYDLAGARLHATTMLDVEHANREFVDSVRAGELDDEPLEPLDAEREFRRAAAAWDRLAPGKGAVYWRAVEAVRRDRARRRFHWTGYSRRKMVALMEDRSFGDGFAARMRSHYALLSRLTHPHAGGSPADLVREENDEPGIVIARPGTDSLKDLLDGVLAVGETALFLTLGALAMRFDDEEAWERLMAEGEAARE